MGLFPLPGPGVDAAAHRAGWRERAAIGACVVYWQLEWALDLPPQALARKVKLTGLAIPLILAAMAIGLQWTPPS